MEVGELDWIDYANIGFAGAMLLVLFFALCAFFYDRKIIYLYYALFIFTIGCYLFSRSTLIYVNITQEIEAFFPRFNKILIHTFQYTAHFASLQFAIHFLNAKEDYPNFYRAAYFTGIFFLSAIVLSLINIYVFNSPSFYFWLINIERSVGTIMALYFQYTLFKNAKNKLVVFYVFGSIMFLIGALLSVIGKDVIYMRMGTLIEIVVFTLGLAYRFKLIQDERNMLREKLILETNQKEKLLIQYNEDLKKQVVERSEQLLKEQEMVQEEKQKVLRLSLEKEVDQMKMKALRAQMKPHFLFNALNAIRAMIIKENPHRAYDYLTDFSRLVRYILESSERNYVSLSEELKMIQLYVQIERMRASGSFNFEVTVDPKIHLTELEIPPLIFQPFIENSIVHAFDAERTDQVVSLEISIKDDSLVIIITDNGKGRKQTGAQTPQEGKSQSMATELTRKRLELLNMEQLNLKIIDLMDAERKPLGTQVVLYIPMIRNGKKIKSTVN